MAATEPDQRPPALPPGAPAELVDFVDCRADNVQIVNAKLRWLPTPSGLPRGFGRFLSPSLSIGPGLGGNDASLAIGWGPVRLRFTATVVDGRLSLAPQGKPPPGLGDVVAEFDRWASDFNRWLAANGKRLEPIAASPGRLVLRKHPHR